MIYICRVKRREKERREDDVCQVTSQAILIYDISLEGKVHIQEGNQLRQIGKVSRLGWKSSRLIEGLVD